MSYKPVPVEEACAISKEYDKSIVIIFTYDASYGLMHTTTYGISPTNKAWAAQGGEIATKALGGLTEASIDFQDYRLDQAKKLLYALKMTVLLFKENNIQNPEINMFKRAIKEAEKFLGEK